VSNKVKLCFHNPKCEQIIGCDPLMKPK